MAVGLMLCLATAASSLKSPKAIWEPPMQMYFNGQNLNDFFCCLHFAVCLFKTKGLDVSFVSLLQTLFRAHEEWPHWRIHGLLAHLKLLK